MRIISGQARGTVLYTLNGDSTRPTLDRVKESLFNIIQSKIREAVVLDLFAGSGALGIESLSRGAKKVVLCDKSKQAINIIKKNLEKTKLTTNAIIINDDYKNAIKETKDKFDIIFIDPPYMENIAVKAVENIIENNLLTDEGLIILETDDEQREIQQLQKINVNVQDLRRYGRVKLIFLNRKG